MAKIVEINNEKVELKRELEVVKHFHDREKQFS